MPDGPLPSLGSAGHGDGSCKRCCFFPKGRCDNGYDCEFCHFDHEKRKRKNKKKSKKKRSGGGDRAAAAAAEGFAQDGSGPFSVPPTPSGGAPLHHHGPPAPAPAPAPPPADVPGASQLYSYYPPAHHH